MLLLSAFFKIQLIQILLSNLMHCCCENITKSQVLVICHLDYDTKKKEKKRKKQAMYMKNEFLKIKMVNKST